MPEMTYKEARKAFLEKYSDILDIIAKKEGVDPDTAINMFKKNVFDGKCYGWRDVKEDFAKLKPKSSAEYTEKFASMEIFKPGSKEAKSYGEKGKNGVIQVTTKAGGKKK